ncbi:MAG: hypothetical protein ACFFDF_10215 [Candidatus Odinarchaeota archaeon]
MRKNYSNYNMNKDKIKEKIVEYLHERGCALKSQITKFLGIDDARYITAPLNELLEERVVLKIIYKRFKFYVMTRNEVEIKRKIKNVKDYILESIQLFGPIKAKKLVNKIRENYGIDFSHRLIYRMARELLLENKIEAKKIALSNIYYEKGNQSQELIALNLVEIYEAKKKSKYLKSLCENFKGDLIENNVFSEEEIKNLNSIFPKIQKILLDFDCKGRTFNDFIQILYFMHIKKEIFFILKKEDYKFEELKPWLNLHETILRLNPKKFHGIGFKTYQYFVKSILADKRFCNQKDKSVILNTPSYLLRMEILLTDFPLNLEFTKKMLKFIESSVSAGYNIAGKDIKGVLGGAIYLYSKTKHLMITQKEIAERLDITEVTLRRRHRELSEFYSTNFEESVKKPKEEPHEIKQNYPKTYKITKITDFMFDKQKEGEYYG